MSNHDKVDWISALRASVIGGLLVATGTFVAIAVYGHPSAWGSDGWFWYAWLPSLVLGLIAFALLLRQIVTGELDVTELKEKVRELFKGVGEI